MLILGSKSPRRKEILEMVGIQFICYASNAKEDIIDLDPISYSKKTALKKASEITKLYPNDCILCADTIVYVDKEILGKPKNRDEAYQMIKKISGKVHQVLTSCYIGNNNDYDLFTVSTDVYVSKLTEEEINNYIDTIEPYDKAGGYAIQGEFGKFIEKIDGDYYNVMGLPINEVYKRLKKYNK